MARLSLCATVAALALAVGACLTSNPGMAADPQQAQKQQQADTPLYTQLPAAGRTQNNVVQAPRDPEAADTPLYTQMPAAAANGGQPTPKDPQDPYSHP